MNKCPVHTCIARIARTKLMCAAHWDLVPLDAQKEVYAGYREMKAGKSVRRWVEARETALRLVAHRLGDPHDA